MEALSLIVVVFLILIAVSKFFVKEIKKQAERELINKKLAAEQAEKLSDQLFVQKEGGSFLRDRDTSPIFYEQEAEEVTGDRINHPLMDLSTEEEKKKMLLYKEIFEPVHKKY